MSIIKSDGGSLFTGVPTLFKDFFPGDLWNWRLENHSATGTTIPAVNIRETDDHFEIEMAAPGMKKNDFRVELDGNMLTITSEKQNQQEEKNGDRYTRKEFSYQSFTRTFQLYKDVVDEDKIQASYENGVLKLLIPKKEQAKQKPRKMIKVS